VSDRERVYSFYRAVKSNPPTDRDYLTPQERRGDPPSHLGEIERRSWDALSFYDTKDGVRQQARLIPAIGKFIARYDIPLDAGITWEQTIAPGHYDIRGDRGMLKRCLTDDIEPL
jgi:hypothetical protein